MLFVHVRLQHQVFNLYGVEHSVGGFFFQCSPEAEIARMTTRLHVPRRMLR